MLKRLTIFVSVIALLLTAFFTIEHFVKKEDYTDILTKYFENMDESLKIYPLTKDLIYIIQNGCKNWWTPDSADKMPAFDGCNVEIAWMFALCYVA